MISIDVNDVMKEKKDYMLKWKNNAKDLNENNHYEWMASHIENYESVLEIGCGVGLSTLSLVAKRKSLIAVDENIECLLETKRILEDKGQDVRLLCRSEFVEYKKGYGIKYHDINERYDSRYIYLIEGDIVKDIELLKWLSSIKFDCIAIWLIGVHGLKFVEKYVLNEIVNMHGPSSNLAYYYRLKLQGSILKNWDKLVKKNGVIHVVDRGKINDIEQFKQERQDDADNQGFSIVQFDTRDYENTQNGVLIGDSVTGTQSDIHGDLISIIYGEKQSILT